MDNNEYAEILRKGDIQWNKWRKDNPDARITLRHLDFHKEFPNKENDYDIPSFENVDFSNIDMNKVLLRNGIYDNCSFDESHITFADLAYAQFYSCTFINTEMPACEIGGATFQDCIFENANLSFCSADETDFSGSKFTNCNLVGMSLISTDFTDTQIISSSVYGISSWDLIQENSKQKNLIITKEDDPVITVDDIELAQFIYLMINNTKLRNVINTITSKVVLILGNFSPNRKAVLDEIREKLHYFDFIPVLYDFEKPVTRNHTETVQTLTSLAKFVIVDLSSPRSVGHEVASIIPRNPSTPIYPIILDGEKEYGMFEDFSMYSWVKPIIKYTPTKIDDVLNKIVEAEKD